MVSTLIKIFHLKYRDDVEQFYNEVQCCQRNEQLIIWAKRSGIFLEEYESVLYDGAEFVEGCPFEWFLGVNGIRRRKVKEVILGVEIAGTDICMQRIFPKLRRIVRYSPKTTIIENNSGVYIE